MTDQTPTPPMMASSPGAPPDAHRLGEDTDERDIATEADWGTLTGTRNPPVAD